MPVGQQKRLAKYGPVTGCVVGLKRPTMASRRAMRLGSAAALLSLKKHSTDCLSAVKYTCFMPPSPIMLGRYSTLRPSFSTAVRVLTLLLFSLVRGRKPTGRCLWAFPFPRSQTPVWERPAAAKRSFGQARSQTGVWERGMVLTTHHLHIPIH